IQVACLPTAEAFHVALTETLQVTHRAPILAERRAVHVGTLGAIISDHRGHPGQEIGVVAVLQGAGRRVVGGECGYGVAAVRASPAVGPHHSNPGAGPEKKPPTSPGPMRTNGLRWLGFIFRIWVGSLLR